MSSLRITNLGEGEGIETVLAGNLEADSVTALGVPDSLGRSLDLAVDLVVVAGSEDAQVVGGGNGSAVCGSNVADGGTVTSDGSLLNIVTSRGTGKETLVANDSINVGSRALEEIEEGTTVESRLLEGKVELGASVVVGGEE